jgi:2-oxoglutarate ferredoxin oxidoreductase subunit gamma
VSSTRGSAGETGSPAPRTGLLAARELVEVRFGGSGGQGVILMGVILAMAGARDHRYVVQTQSYGPEARGGYSRSDVIVSDAPIDYPELEQADLLVALSQAAADEYIGVLGPDGVLVYDSENVMAVPRFQGERFGIPFTRLALEETGRTQTTNILTLGAVAGITGVVTTGSLRKAVLAMVPAGTEEMNQKALARGLALDAGEWRAADPRRSTG